MHETGVRYDERRLERMEVGVQRGEVSTILHYDTGKPETTEVIKGLMEYLSDDSSFIAYNMASAKARRTS